MSGSRIGWEHRGSSRGYRTRHLAAFVLVSLVALLLVEPALATAETVPAAPVAPLSLGSRGAGVAALQRALDRATYPAGAPDGRFGAVTQEAVWAYQKVHGLTRSGVVTSAEYRWILAAKPPPPPLPGRARYVYVDLARQVLFEVHAGVVTHTIPISTGGGYTYLDRYGVPHLAETPTGNFVIQYKIAGWVHSYLGYMYYPNYFDDGYAIHGDTYVPPFPVSHGCIRMPDWLAIGFFGQNPVGTPVIVVG